MSIQHSTQYKGAPNWGLSDSFRERIKPFIPKPKFWLRGRGKHRQHIGGRRCAEPPSRNGGYSFAHGLPVERRAKRVGFRQNFAPLLSALDERASLREAVEERSGRIRGGEGDRMEVADGRWSDHEIPFRGQVTDANPTDRTSVGRNEVRWLRPKGCR